MDHVVRHNHFILNRANVLFLTMLMPKLDSLDWLSHGYSTSQDMKHCILSILKTPHLQLFLIGVNKAASSWSSIILQISSHR